MNNKEIPMGIDVCVCVSSLAPNRNHSGKDIVNEFNGNILSALDCLLRSFHSFKLL